MGIFAPATRLALGTLLSRAGLEGGRSGACVNREALLVLVRPYGLTPYGRRSTGCQIELHAFSFYLASAPTRHSAEAVIQR